MSAICLLFGHAVAPEPQPSATASTRKCRCGSPYLQKGELTRARHHLGCFFRGHVYGKISRREGWDEYGCLHCGHPLLRQAKADEANSSFRKRVRYACNLYGHKSLREVAQRQGSTEYACDCGHSFLKATRGLRQIKHPSRCLFLGHWLCFVGGATEAEYACVHCGHTFYL